MNRFYLFDLSDFIDGFKSVFHIGGYVEKDEFLEEIMALDDSKSLHCDMEAIGGYFPVFKKESDTEEED